jgi:hypothetical protein
LNVILIHSSGHGVGELPKYKGSCHLNILLFRVRLRVTSPSCGGMPPSQISGCQYQAQG